jgi:hypothetical protein
MSFVISHWGQIASILLSISELFGLAGKGGFLAIALDLLKKSKDSSAS